jgi:2-hydroxy-palmitic acid dioxygenase Mpo1-like
MKTFLKALEEQRWDDHRFYHHSRVNQTLHLLSALTFLCSYVLLFVRPALAGLLGWLVAMVIRQIGHFFFEPKGYDEVNQVTHDFKEEVKVGYNLQRKVVLLSVWALSPLVLSLEPTLFGIFAHPLGASGFLRNVSIVWLGLGVGAVLFRTVHLFFLRDLRTGLVWLTKILTDPFHDIVLYYRAPIHLLHGELLDSMARDPRA